MVAAIAPVRASDRSAKRVAPIPAKVKTAVRLMVYGKPDVPEAELGNPDAVAPLSYVQAARAVKMEPYRLRRWFDDARVIALIRSERAIFRRALCCANESALARIRDHGENAAAAVRATLALEQIDAEHAIQSRGAQSTPGITIHIIQPPAPAIEPQHVAAIEHAERVDVEPVFNPNTPVFDDDR